MHSEVDVEPIRCSRSRADAYGGNVAVLAYIPGVGQAKVLECLSSLPVCSRARIAVYNKLNLLREMWYSSKRTSLQTRRQHGPTRLAFGLVDLDSVMRKNRREFRLGLGALSMNPIWKFWLAYELGLDLSVNTESNPPNLISTCSGALSR
jgi:hypothetical protein